MLDSYRNSLTLLIFTDILYIFYDDNQMEAKPQSPDDTLNHLRPVSMPHVEASALFNLAACAYSRQAIAALKSYLLYFDSIFCNKCGHKWHLVCIIVIVSVCMSVFL